MRIRRRQPVWLDPVGPIRFPDPADFDAAGLIAIGGDLSVPRLLAAYRAGVFPWFDADSVPLWWSPDPRGVLDAAALHVPRRLARTMRRADLAVSWNRCFAAVVAACAEGRPDGTWIVPALAAAYAELHRAGHAHSLEVWQAGELVGGIYGVQIGGLFAAESMFHRGRDMSKVALVALVRSLAAAGTTLFDVQFATPHLVALGASDVPRREYLCRLRASVDRVVDLRDLAPAIHA